MTKLFVITFFALCCGAVHAEQMQLFDDYEVHYIVFNSLLVPPTDAAAYNIKRAKNRAVVNISVRKRVGDGKTVAQKSRVSGYSTDLMRNMPLKFTEVAETDAIYYLAQLKYYPRDLRRFIIDVQVPGKPFPYTLKFTQTLYLETKP